MQMKKFEARTMKEALEMVKTQLGPDAVILSAKEITKGFGLGGQKSIEITAAYSEKVLQNKKFVESKMPETIREVFNRAPAKMQKQAIIKTVQNRLNEQSVQASIAKSNASMTKTNSTSSVASSTASATRPRAQMRYIDIDENTDMSATEKAIVSQQQNLLLTQKAQQTFQNSDVESLKSELNELKSLLSQFKQMPQSFVQTHPGAEYGVNYGMSSQFQRLIKKGILPVFAGELIQSVQNMIPVEKQTDSVQAQAFVDGALTKIFLEQIQVRNDVSEQFHLFFGPSGSGKTTTMVKLASELVLKHKKSVALISTDTIKVGADEQMKLFAQILNLPFVSIRSEQDWFKIAPYLGQVDHVLVDFASLSLKFSDELTYIEKMRPALTDSMRSHLVLSATAKDSDLVEIAQRYQKIDIDDVVFTSLDEASVHGNIYNFVRQIRWPLFAFGIGPRTPEDFEMATAERIIDLILELTKNHQQSELSL